MRILLVEDHASERRPLAELLRDEGHTVVEAECAQSALTRFAAGAFDIVLLDYELPDQNGPYVIKQIRARDGDCPVVFVTGSAALEMGERGASFDTHEAEGRGLGVVAHVIKPVNFDRLLDIIDRHARR